MRHTTLEQALLDALASAEKYGNTEKAAVYREALKAERSDQHRFEIDKTFAGHQYKGVRYGQLSNVRDNPAVWLMVKELSPKAAKLLLSVLCIATTEYIAISRKHLADMIGETNKSRIRAVLDELTEAKALRLVSEYDVKSSTPAVYRINSIIFRVGKRRKVSHKDLEEFFGRKDIDVEDKEFLPVLFRRMDSAEHNANAGYYPSTRKMRVPSASKDAPDGYQDVIVSTIEYYSNSPAEEKKEPSLAPKKEHENSSPSDYNYTGQPVQMSIFDVVEGGDRREKRANS